MPSPGQGLSHWNQWFFENSNNQTIGVFFFFFPNFVVSKVWQISPKILSQYNAQAQEC